MMHLFIFLFLIIPVVVHAEVAELPKKITVENFDGIYTNVTHQYREIIDKTPPELLKKFKQARGAHHFHFTGEQTQVKNDFLKLQEQKYDLDPIAHLRDDLKNLYLKHEKPSVEKIDELHKEASLLAVNLFAETRRLKKTYKLVPLPMVHNGLINFGIKQRGACKHWAEDILAFLQPLPREFFSVTWGEAYPGKMLEHNVTVVIPKGHSFADGLLFDPWRTGGKPFWVRVGHDPHYDWKQWEEYGVY